MTGAPPDRPTLASRAFWFLRTRPTLLRRFFQKALASAPLPSSRRRVSERWSPAEAESLVPRVWTSARVVREYLHERVSGNPACDWVTWMVHRHAAGENLRALVLGSGEGWLERALASNPRIASVTAVDLSLAAVERAREAAAREGLSARVLHEVADLERDPLPAGPWDLVLAHDVIHHVRGLDALFSRISEALAPGGRLLFCEYVGPARFDYGRRREAILDEALRSLPEKYRKLPGERGMATRGHRTDPGELALRDPSEAVRSDRILPALRASMNVIEEISYGGSLLAPLLYELVENFHDGDAGDDAVLRRLCARESELIASGQLPSDYVVVAARRRAAVPAAGDR
ncbi:MAG TPA: class I SAM-dependent methyltransferase [Thermoanaerobaculia bacterium]